MGGSGNDVIVGSNESDTLEGGAGVDFIFGQGGDDLIRGNGDIDYLYGEDGNDQVQGDSGDDVIYGGAGDDQLKGGSGSDVAYGENGNDRLLGGDGNDLLFGGNGIDALYGAAGADELNGGPDSDRFLDSYTNGFLGVNNWSDNHVDKTSDDARVGFNDGNQSETCHDNTYAAGTWTEDDVVAVDEGLKVLHEATANKNLLERAPNGIFNGNLVILIRQGELLVPAADGFRCGAWNSNDGEEIFLPDASFDAGKSTAETIIHEFGHNWDDEYDAAGWQAKSGWIESAVPLGGNFAQGPDNPSQWWYDTSLEGFVSDYATNNPHEDFASSFANYFMNLAGLSFQGNSGGSDISTLPTKQTFMDDFLVDLS